MCFGIVAFGFVFFLVPKDLLSILGGSPANFLDVGRFGSMLRVTFILAKFFFFFNDPLGKAKWWLSGKG